MSPEELHGLYDEPGLEQSRYPDDAVARATLRTAVQAVRRLRDETDALHRLHIREARKLPGWKTLNRTDKHVARWLARLMTSPHSGEIFKNEKKLSTLIPPAPTQRRPNTSGHISRTTLRSSLERIEAAGIFTSWKTLGKRVPGQWRTEWGRDGRTPAIRVWRLNRDAWARAWGTFKQTVRRNLNTVKAEAQRPLEVRSSPSQLRPSRHSGRFRTWAEAGIPVTAIGLIYGLEEAVGYAVCLARAA